VVNTQQAKRTDERDVSPKHSAVAAIDGDAQTRPIIAGLPQAHSALSWEQAIYQFPTENVAILDEDGQIISANNYWLATSERAENDIERIPGIGLNYSEFLRLLLPKGEARIAIENFKQLIRGEVESVIANYDFDGIHARPSRGVIAAYKLVDSPNTLAIIHRFGFIAE
jgi:hypothetical protein